MKSEKNEKEGWKCGAGAGLLKGGRTGTFPIQFLFSSRLIIFALRNYFTLCKSVKHLKKNYFFLNHNFMEKKVILNCLQMNLCVYEEGWCVGLGQELSFLHEGGGIA